MRHFLFSFLCLLTPFSLVGQESADSVTSKLEADDPCFSPIITVPYHRPVTEIKVAFGWIYSFNVDAVFCHQVNNPPLETRLFQAPYGEKPITDFDFAVDRIVFTTEAGFLYEQDALAQVGYASRLLFNEGFTPPETRISAKDEDIYILYSQKLVHAGYVDGQLVIHREYELDFLNAEAWDVQAVKDGILVTGVQAGVPSVFHVWGFGAAGPLSSELLLNAPTVESELFVAYLNGAAVIGSAEFGVRLYIQDENGKFGWASDLYGQGITGAKLDAEGVFLGTVDGVIHWLDISDPHRPFSVCRPFRFPDSVGFLDFGFGDGYLQAVTDNSQHHRVKLPEVFVETYDFPWVPTNQNFSSDLTLANLSSVSGTVTITGIAPDGREKEFRFLVPAQSTRNFNPSSFGFSTQNLAMTVNPDVEVKAALRIRGRDQAGQGRPPAMLDPVLSSGMQHRLVFPLVPGDRTASIAIRAPKGEGETAIVLKLLGASGVLAQQEMILEGKVAVGVLLSNLFSGVAFEDAMSLIAESNDTLLSGSQFSFNDTGHPAGSAALSQSTAYQTETLVKMMDLGSNHAVARAAIYADTLALLKPGKVEIIDLFGEVIGEPREIAGENVVDVAVNAGFLFLLVQTDESSQIRIHDLENLSYLSGLSDLDSSFRYLAASDALLAVSGTNGNRVWLLDANGAPTETNRAVPAQVESQIVLVENRAYFVGDNLLQVETYNAGPTPQMMVSDSEVEASGGKIGVLGDHLLVPSLFGAEFFTNTGNALQSGGRQTLFATEGSLRQYTGTQRIRQVIDMAFQAGEALHLIDSFGLQRIREDGEKALYQSGSYPLENAVQVVAGPSFVGVVQGDGRFVLLHPEKSYNRVIPWLTAGGDFESRVLIHNDGSQAAEVNLTAVDRAGNRATTTRQIPAGSAFATWSADLFPSMSGYSLRIGSEAEQLSAAMEVYKSEDVLSPAQMIAPAVALPGNGFTFPYLTVGDLSALVLTRVDESTDTVKVRLRWRTVDGLQAETTSLELQGNQPKAVLIRDIAPRVDGPVAVTVEPLEGVVLSGAAFLFDEYGRPAMSGPQ